MPRAVAPCSPHMQNNDPPLCGDRCSSGAQFPLFCLTHPHCVLRAIQAASANSISMAGVDEVEHEVPFRDGKPPIPVKVLFAPNASKTPNFQGESYSWSHYVHGKKAL